MIRVVIIDDEPRNIKLIEGMIRDHHPNLEVVGTTDDLRKALPLVETLKPSLLLLDIGFPSGTIFSILEQITVKNFDIIFITAHNNYATEAFKHNAVDYILKPVTKEAFDSVIKKVEARIHTKAVTDFSKLLNALKSGLDRPEKIPLPSAEGILFVDETDIIRCEAKSRYTIIHLTGNKKLTVSKTLKEIESLLDPHRFFRIHHSHIINLAMIRQYRRGQGGTAELTDGSLIEVSSSRKEEFLKVLLHRRR